MNKIMHLTPHFGAPVEYAGAISPIVPFFKALGGKQFGYCVSIARYPVATP